jgi:hypothetical protein
MITDIRRGARLAAKPVAQKRGSWILLRPLLGKHVVEIRVWQDGKS